MINRHRQTIACAMWICALYLASASVALAQSTADTLADALRERTTSEQVVLHNFSAQPRVSVEVTPSGVRFAPTSQKSFSLIRFTTVSVSGQQITVQGTKRHLLRKPDGKLTPLDVLEPVTMVVDVDPAVTHDTLSSATADLFFSNVDAALKEVPEDRVGKVPSRDKPGDKAANPATSCDCSQNGTPACLPNTRERGWTYPSATSRGELRLPKELPDYGSFKCSALVEIGTDGHVGDIWMLYVTHAPLAQTCFQTIQQYRFKPATCHGVPLQSDLIIDKAVQKY